MNQEEINKRVKTFVDMEDHSGTPIVMTAENVARLCVVTVEEAEVALSAIPSTRSGTKMNDER